MMNKARVWLSYRFLKLSCLTAPKVMQPVLFGIAKAHFGLAGEIKRGRTGGLITARWYVDEDGKRLSARMQDEATRKLARIRAAHERYKATENADDNQS